MSTQKAKEGSETAMSKFARGSRLAQSDAHEKYREDCQRIFDLQNRSLASHEILSTDDDTDSNDNDSDVDEMGKNLETMLQSKITTVTSENKKELKKLLMPDQENTKMSNHDSNSSEKHDPKSKNPVGSDQMAAQKQNRILKITRTHRDEDTGKDYTTVEIIKKSLIIDAYIKIRTTKDDNFIRQAFALDEEEKEQLRKERRRIQEQLRRVKRSEAAARRSKDADEQKKKKKEPKVKKPPKKKYKMDKTGLNLNDSSIISASSSPQHHVVTPKEPHVKTVRCGACHAIGHSRTNRECPMYVPKDLNASQNINNESIDETSQISGLTKVKGTKLIIDKRLIPAQ